MMTTLLPPYCITCGNIFLKKLSKKIQIPIRYGYAEIFPCNEFGPRECSHTIRNFLMHSKFHRHSLCGRYFCIIHLCDTNHWNSHAYNKQNYFYLSKLLSYGNPKFHFFYKSLKLTNILNIRVPRKIVPSWIQGKYPTQDRFFMVDQARLWLQICESLQHPNLHQVVKGWPKSYLLSPV